MSSFVFCSPTRKKTQLRKVKRTLDIEERMLFHGTGHSNIQAICTFNFDWRLTGSHGDVYGKGTPPLRPEKRLVLRIRDWFSLCFSQGATLPAMPSTPVSFATPQGNTTQPYRDTDSRRLYLPASRILRPCSWPECSSESTRWAIPCTADLPPRMPASLTFMTVVWTTWPIQRSMSFLTAIRFIRSIWLNSTEKLFSFFYCCLLWAIKKDEMVERCTEKHLQRWAFFFVPFGATAWLEGGLIKVPLESLKKQDRDLLTEARTFHSVWTIYRNLLVQRTCEQSKLESLLQLLDSKWCQTLGHTPSFTRTVPHTCIVPKWSYFVFWRTGCSTIQMSLSTNKSSRIFPHLTTVGV